MNKTDPEKSLLALLLAAVAIMIFLPLDSVALFPDELQLLDLARELSQSGIGSLIDDVSAPDFSAEAYAYLVSVGLNVFRLPEILAVRLPSATVIAMLAIGIFRFRGKSELPRHAFLASLIFISSYTVSALAYHANPLTLASLFLITALAALYHKIKEPSATKSYLLTAASACTVVFFGALAPAFICIAGIIFLSLQEKKRPAEFFKLAAIAVASCALAFLTAAFLTNDAETASRMLGIGRLTEPIAEYSHLKIMALQLLFSIFPWSVPIIVALGWLACNPHWIKERFLALGLFKQFGVIIFILTLPFATALNGISLIMTLTAIYFNVSLISKFLLSQTFNHTLTWRITGNIFAILTAALSAVYTISAAAGIKVSLFGHSFLTESGIRSGAILLLCAITATIYTLSRNQRTIRLNNRYLYNIVILYMLAQILYKAYISPCITAM